MQPLPFKRLNENALAGLLSSKHLGNGPLCFRSLPYQMLSILKIFLIPRLRYSLFLRTKLYYNHHANIYEVSRYGENSPHMPIGGAFKCKKPKALMPECQISLKSQIYFPD